MAVISESQAWQIVDSFAQALVAATDDVIAIFVIGSLASGAYRAGRSDIDTLIVICDESAESTPAMLRAIGDDFQQRFAIPKGLGAVVIRHRQLFPPYDPEEELIPEILRLQQPGICVWGQLDLSAIPVIEPADLEAYMVVFFRWLHAHYVEQRPEAARTIDATINTILYEVRALIWGATGKYILDKRQVLLEASSLVADAQTLDTLTLGILAEVASYLDSSAEESKPVSYWEDALHNIAHKVYKEIPLLAPRP